MCGYPSVELASNHFGREDGACSYDTLSTAGVSAGRSTRGRHDRPLKRMSPEPVGIRRRIAVTPAGKPGHTAPDIDSPDTTTYDARREPSRTEEITRRDDQRT